MINIIADDRHLVTRECCEKHSKQDCLVLGLFKKEWSGKELVALNSKLYIGSTQYIWKRNIFLRIINIRYIVLLFQRHVEDHSGVYQNNLTV